MGKYFIFSDEAGSWSNRSDRFYVRSWLRIKEDDYLYIEGLWKTKKLPKPTEGSLLKNSNGISDELNKKNFNFFFTFTKLNEFYSRKFYVRDKILESVSLAISQLENQLKSYMKNKIPAKIQNSINQIMFLNIYEAYHIENAIKVLCEADSNYEFYIDKPQFAENDYLEIFNNQVKNINQAKLIFSHKKEGKPNNLGVYYADALASMFKKILNSKNHAEITRYLKTHIFTKSYAGNIGTSGFNKIFYPVNKSYGNDELKSEEKALVNNLSTKLNV
jgi:hypothetical protein